MTKRISDTQPVLEFIDIATKYCVLIENRDEKTQIEFLQDAFVILPQLCLAGARLPYIQRLSDYELPSMSHEQWDQLFTSLKDKLKDYDCYAEVYHPYDESYRESVYGSLSDDLSDIYRDIKSGLEEWTKVTVAEKRDIIWEWQFGFESHWGEHATGAFRSLYWLLFHYIEDAYGDYIGLTEYE